MNRLIKTAVAAPVCLALAAAGPAGAGATPAPRVPTTGSTVQEFPSFYPSSVTFVSLEDGWALGGATCGHSTCLDLRKTVDGGRSWSAQPLPAALVSAADRWPEGNFSAGTALNVRFADPRDGWIFGFVRAQTSTGIQVRATVWATHDGGRSWAPVSAAGLSSPYSAVLDLEAGAGSVYMLLQVGDTVKLLSSNPGGTTWTTVQTPRFGLPAGGSNLEGAIVLQGGRGWVVVGNDRGTTGSARLTGGRWQAWSPPCADVGGTLAFPAASGAGYLAAVCVMGGFASPLSRFAPSGATIGSSWLYQSTDAGTTFSPVVQLGKLGQFVGGVVASPAPGAVLLSRSSAHQQQLLATFDGGTKWSDVYNGTFSYLGFTSPLQGVAIAGTPAGRTAMIMTHDGGRDWQKVSF